MTYARNQVATISAIASCCIGSIATSIILLYLDANLLATCLAGGSCIAFSLAVLHMRNGSIIQLDILFFMILSLYSLTSPLLLSISGHFQYSDQALVRACILSLLAIIGYLIGWIIGCIRLKLPTSYRRHIPDISAEELARLRKIGLFFVAFGGCASFASIMATVGFKSYIAAGYAGRALIKQQTGPIELGLYVITIGITLLFYVLYINKGKSRRLESFFYMVLFVIVFLYVSFLGVRRPSFLLLSGTASIIMIHRQGRHTLFIFTAVIPITFAFTTFAHYRQILASNGFLETVNYINEHFSIEWFDLSSTELGAPFRTLVDCMSGYFTSELRLGQSYIASIFYLLPSFLHLGVDSLSVEYTNNYFTWDFLAIGGNMGFSPIAEAFINFGIAGVLIVFAMLGYIMLYLNTGLYKSGPVQPRAVLLYSILVPWFAFFMRLDFASFSKGLIYSQILPVFLVWSLLNPPKLYR